MHNWRIYRDVNGKQVEGKVFWVIVNNFNYWLAQLVVYGDGMVDCWGLMNKKELLEKLHSGWIRIDLPDDCDLFIGLSRVSIKEFFPEKNIEDFIKELDEAILELSGQKSNRFLCIELFKKYLLDSNSYNFNELKDKFDKLPKHSRVLFEYVYHKDPLYKLMNGQIEKFDIEGRRFMLNDYFEGEWNEDELI